MKKEIRVVNGDYAGVITLKADSYFSATCWFGGSNGFGGADHKTILKLRPDLEPFVKMHLSEYPHGTPMYAVENGYYWLSGIVDVGEKQSNSECLDIAAKHFRISTNEVLKLAKNVKAKFDEGGRKMSMKFLEDWCSRRSKIWREESDAAFRILEGI